MNVAISLQIEKRVSCYRNLPPCRRHRSLAPIFASTSPSGVELRVCLTLLQVSIRRQLLPRCLLCKYFFSPVACQRIFPLVHEVHPPGDDLNPTQSQFCRRAGKNIFKKALPLSNNVAACRRRKSRYIIRAFF